MVVLSLFDGKSGGQIALVDMGRPPDTYYASEIDKHAIAQTQLNFPNTIQLGSVVDVDVSRLKPIDLLIGGSPCQSFSFAGKRNGMSTKCEIEITRLEQYLELRAEGFAFEGQSYLFWEYMRILTDIRKYNPDVLFLLENVEMGKKWERVLSEAIGIYGVHINSALVSAQNRKRIYWTNIRVKKVGLFKELHSDIPQPADRGILLKDNLEQDVDEKYYIKSDSMLSFVTDKWRQDKAYTQINGDKALPQMARQYSSWCGDYVDDSEQGTDYTPFAKKEVVGLDFDKMNTLTTAINKDNLVMQINPSTESGGKQPYQQNRVYDSEGISPALCANKADLMVRLNDRQQKNFVAHDEKTNSLLSTSYKGSQANGMSITNSGYRIRRLTPLECARLQTIPEWYRWECSDTQAYRMLGNGWTNEVIKHIFSYLPKQLTSNEQQQGQSQQVCACTL